MKKGLLPIIPIISLATVSAYSTNFYNFNVTGLLNNMASYLPMAVGFLVIFALFYLGLSKTIFGHKKAIAGVIAGIIDLFLLNYLRKRDFGFEEIFYKIGFTETFLYSALPWILLTIAVLLIWFWGFGTMFITFGIVTACLGIFGIIYESGLAVVIGTILILLGIKIYRYEKRRQEYKKLDLDKKQSYKEGRRTRRKEIRQKWNDAGYKAGKRIGKWIYGRRTKKK